VRIIAGTLKGRRLEGPRGPGVRPTSDRLRETLFNVLADRPDEARVLDAFAGTGAVGLEALSRGATSVVFVERDRRVISLLEDNIRACRVGNACVIIADDFLTFRARRPDLGSFDLVFADPPYEGVDLGAVVTVAASWVASSGLVVLEHSRRHGSPEQAGGLTRRRVLPAGDSALSFYTPEA